MSAGLRRAGLTFHVVSSVGWIGAVVASLGLAVAGALAKDPVVARGSFVALGVLGWWVLVPFSLLSLVGGVVQAAGTHWGLARHYWVVVKLGLNLAGSVVLVAYTQTLGGLASTARSGGPLHGPSRFSPIVHAVLALALLIAAAALSVYKPRGLTRRGRRSTRLPSSAVTP